MTLIGLPALAIVAVLAHVLAGLIVRLGAPDSRPFVARAFWITCLLEVLIVSGAIDAVGGAL